MLEERAPSRLVLFGALADAQNLAITFAVYADRDQQRDIADFSRPAALEHDAVQVNIGMLALDRPIAPGLDGRVDLLVEVRDCRWRHPRAPQGLRNILDPAHRDARQIHLDQCFLHRALPAAVPLNDRSLKGLTPQLWNLEVYFAGAGLQRPIVAASPGVLPSLAALVTAGTAKLVCLSIKHGIQRLFHRPTNHLAKMVSDPGFIDLDHLTHWILVTHRLLLHSMKKPSLPKVRKIRHVISRGQSSEAVEPPVRSGTRSPPIGSPSARPSVTL